MSPVIHSTLNEIIADKTATPTIIFLFHLPFSILCFIINNAISCRCEYTTENLFPIKKSGFILAVNPGNPIIKKSLIITNINVSVEYTDIKFKISCFSTKYSISKKNPIILAAIKKELDGGYTVFKVPAFLTPDIIINIKKSKSNKFIEKKVFFRIFLVTNGIKKAIVITVEILISKLLSDFGKYGS